jgi:hypothetical protein
MAVPPGRPWLLFVWLASRRAFFSPRRQRHQCVARNCLLTLLRMRWKSRRGPMMFSTILINREDPCSTDARTLLDRLSATLGFFTGSGGQSRSSVLNVALERAPSRGENGLRDAARMWRIRSARRGYCLEVLLCWPGADGVDGVGSAILAQPGKSRRTAWVGAVARQTREQSPHRRTVREAWVPSNSAYGP